MEEPKITPLARRLAEENGIDWRRLKGTGPEGTIVERDILAFLAKVMAGEVDLPPAPEAPPPLPPEQELKRAQEVLGREGVDLADLIPEAPGPQVEGVLEEELELDFPEVDLLDEEALLLPEEEAPEPLEAWEEELLSAREALPGEGPGEAVPGEDEVAFTEEALWAAPEEVEEGLAHEAPEGLREGSPAEDLPLVAAVPLAQNPTPGPLLGAAPVPTQALGALRVFRRRVDLEALKKALEPFRRHHGVPETPLPFLLKAAERALGELELPYGALLGRAEGEGVRGIRPSPSFLALFRQEEGEEGEGLLCFFGEEEVHTGRPSLFLFPDGVLAASGLEAPLARKLLERVALYLENPVLLLA
ncbi:E3 binding domain-containing protein [Thermus sediminis]|uniref:E3 binding domain-containing protein n=1 Tax=Thermus sediminis TaxID=1761908 RepID=UPI000E3D84AC|nr:E3 binding domain-containing protein [Thermus sediminis]